MLAGRWWIAGAAIAYGVVGMGMSVAGCTDAHAREVRSRPLKEITAKVLRVDTAKGLIALEVRGALTTFRVDAETVFFMPGRQVTLDDLREGQQVRAIYEVGREGPPLLQWVELEEAPAPVPGSAR